ncbi:MAG: ABC transporter ATP-binding protein [Clostridia bacterium]|nr:ABC transporter ATP-binding protein [Clostridia bacterium]
MSRFETKDLAVGYGGSILIHDINVKLERGQILTLIGPNGAGKSTVLKSVARQLAPIGGAVYIDGRKLSGMTQKELSKQMSVVLTDRIRPELMTCAEVVAMGRYPYTDMFGRLTEEDRDAVRGALSLVRALELSERDFSTLSDGQRQRIMLARAICQEPSVMVLDEPTAYLDIRHKIELLAVLRDMAKRGVTVIMSLHEIDLAVKISDLLLCLKGDTVAAFGTPEEILGDDTIERLYDLMPGSYDLTFGSVELLKPEGLPRVFVVSGAGSGVPVFRGLQKTDVPFAAGILFENDVDFHVAQRLSDFVVSAPPFEPMTDAHFNAASRLLSSCGAVIDAGAPMGTLNAQNARLISFAKSRDIPVYESLEAMQKREKVTI